MVKRFPIKILVVLIVFYLILSTIYDEKLPNTKESVFFLQKQLKNSYQFSLDLAQALETTIENRKISNEKNLSRKEMLALKQFKKALDQQNNKLLKALRFEKTNKLSLIPAKVISRSPDSWYSFVIINKGSASHIKINDPVINSQGLVGEVTEVFLNHAKVSLITDRQMRVGCEIRKYGDVGVSEGAGFNSLVISYIPIDSAVSSGDIIISSGHSNKFPAGLDIATVTETGGSITDIFKQVKARPLVNLSGLDILFVVRN